MRLLDRNLKGHILQYVAQCLIATATLGVVLFYMDIVMETAVVASIGATSFIIFTMPHTNGAKPKYILGGYAVGTIVGVLSNYLLVLNIGIPVNIVGAIAVGLAMFVMVITNTEHPPAAALALGIAIEGYTLNILIFVYGVAISLLLIKWLLRKWLIDLL